MEDVLDVYEMPYNPSVPVVCMDEKPYQLLGEARESWAMRPGDNKKIDSEYIRNGTCSIFAFIEPLGGKHHVSVREHRTAVDWAEEIKYLVDTLKRSFWSWITSTRTSRLLCIKNTSRKKLVGSSGNWKSIIPRSMAVGWI